jgi:hypothetical protein
MRLLIISLQNPSKIIEFSRQTVYKRHIEVHNKKRRKALFSLWTLSMCRGHMRQDEKAGASEGE